jgi:hypothetical protein
MSEQRKKSESILLRAEGKTVSLELFPAGQWPEENIGDGLFRVRINDVWHCPAGKYSFLTRGAVGELVAGLLGGESAREEEEPVPYLPWKADVRVYLEDEPDVSRGTVHAPPHRESDGRWHVWVWVYGRGPLNVPCDDVTLLRVR